MQQDRFHWTTFLDIRVRNLKKPSNTLGEKQIICSAGRRGSVLPAAAGAEELNYTTTL